MNRRTAWSLALCALTWSLSMPVLAQSKGSRDSSPHQKSEQSRGSAQSRSKSRDSAPTVNKSDSNRDGSRSTNKSRR